MTEKNINETLRESQDIAASASDDAGKVPAGDPAQSPQTKPSDEAGADASAERTDGAQPSADAANDAPDAASADALGGSHVHGSHSLGDVILKVEHLAFGYTADRPILKDINFEVHKGEVLMILGANGCGKTTLMKTLIRENRHSKGAIILKGRDVHDHTEKEIARNISMVFQDHSAPFPYPAIEVVKMGRAPYLPVFGRPSKEDVAIAEEALAHVGMSHVADEPYTNLSGGQRQMVLIARALAQQTDLVLMDEPTSALDYRNASIVINAAYALATEHDKAVVMITHAPDQAFYYPSTSALMKGGRFFAYGPSEEVLTSESLSEVYNMRIKVLPAVDPVSGQRFLTCRPLPQSA